MHRKPKRYAPFAWVALALLSALIIIAVLLWSSPSPATVPHAIPLARVTHSSAGNLDTKLAQGWIKEQHAALKPKHRKHHVPQAIAAPVVAQPVVTQAPAPPSPPPAPVAGILSFDQLEQLWVQAGGPAAAETEAATVAECESGGNPQAYNPSGATGLWQILGQVVSGDLYDPLVNAENAVSKYEASGDTWAQWVCQP